MQATESMTSGWPRLGATSNTQYYLIAPDVVAVVPNAGEKDDLESARENVEFQMRYARAHGQKCAFVVVLSRLVAQDSGARRTYAEGMDPALCFASALVVTSPLSRAIGSFFLGLTRPRIPTRAFESLASALAWIDVMRAEEAA